MPIQIAMPVADFFGAGTCGKYLVREFSQKMPTFYDRVPNDHSGIECDFGTYRPLTADVDIPLIQFTGPNLEQQTAFRGAPNVGYIFSEWQPITAQQKENLKAFDVLIAGSQWNAEVIRDAGFTCHAVAQGVDTTIFRPQERESSKFVIYSGGKWEHRKAQDLVVKAVKIMQARHDNVVLVASWVNLWTNADHYAETMMGANLIGLPILDHRALAHFMSQTDVGLFPNRCEGGTNLVMMDYLACGRPVIANTSTGQRDVLAPSYCIGIEGEDAALVEQMVEGLETLYRDRELRRRMGAQAAQAMLAWPWSRTANEITGAINAARH